MTKKIVDTHTTDLKNAADNAVKTIASAAESATKLLASAAESASRLLASNAADAIKSSNIQSAADHDILVVLRSKMEDLRIDIKDLKDTTTKRVDNLEINKLNVADSYAVIYKKDVDNVHLDQETRIRSIETNITRMLTWGSVGILAIGAIEIILTHYLK